MVWRVTSDERGAVIVDIAEIWAVSARSGAEVYLEMARRVAGLADSPARRSLYAVVERLGLQAKNMAPRPPRPPTRPEPWLVDRLVHTAGLAREHIEAMTSEQAVDAWTEFMMRGR